MVNVLKNLAIDYIIFPVFFNILGTEQNDPKLYTNFTGFPQKSEALDNDLYTVFLSDTQEDPLWFLKLNSTYEIKWILISIREGMAYYFKLTFF